MAAHIRALAFGLKPTAHLNLIIRVRRLIVRVLLHSTATVPV